MMKLLLGLDAVPAPHDAADALAVAICHVHSATGSIAQRGEREKREPLGARRSTIQVLECCTGRRRLREPARGRRCGSRAAARRRARDACAVGPRETAHRDRPPQRHARREAPGRIIVDVGGVGYDVLVPLSTFYTLGGARRAGRRCASTRTCARTSIALYGFAHALEQDLFERLISISGIGPKLALAVLSGIEPGELVRAIAPAGRRAADGDSRRRQEDRRADRPGAEGPPAARALRRRAGCRGRVAGRPAARRSAVGADQSRLPAGRRPRRRSRQRWRESRRTRRSRTALRDVLRGMMVQ